MRRLENVVAYSGSTERGFEKTERSGRALMVVKVVKMVAASRSRKVGW
jgi:hypothetical protein